MVAIVPFPSQTVDPILPVTLTVLLDDGSTPDSVSFSATGITFGVAGATGTFSPPATSTGGSISVAVSAVKNNATLTTTASFIVRSTVNWGVDSTGTPIPYSPPTYLTDTVSQNKPLLVLDVTGVL